MKAMIAAALVAAYAPDAHAGSCAVPGFQFAAFGFQSVDMQNGGTDSWSSINGAYSSSKCSGSSCIGGVGTNGTQSGAISLGPNGGVAGSCQIGFGGSTSNITNGSKCSSDAVAASSMFQSVVTAPSEPNANPFAPSSGTLAANKAYGDISLSGQGSITLNTGVYVMNSLATSGQATVNVGTGPIVVYLTGAAGLSLAGQGGINNNTGIPSNIVFMCTNTVTSVSVVGNGNAYYAVYCPNAAITVTGNGAIYGAVVGKTVSFSGNNGMVHYDAALASYTNGQITCGSTVEISRAAPVIPTLASSSCANGASCAAVVQGTFTPPSIAKASLSNHASVSSWTFPYITGHMRARDASTITSAASIFSSGTILFDAATKIPSTNYTTCGPPLNGSCRYVFTNTTTSFHPSMVSFTDTNASTIGNLIAPSATYTDFASFPNDYKTVLHDIVGATLGGVDRSTVAVIQASPYTASGSRPTIAYFGATDGMLHAVCASTGGSTASQASSVCPSQGTELWAFMPRVQLPLVRTNDQRIDGSVRVLDAFGDFTNNPATGTKSWHTILVFQTGYAKSGVASPAAYALDVTDPASPVVLWEYTTPSPAATLDFGTGLGADAGVTLVNGAQQNLVVLETNNGGTGTAGVVSTALALETGTKQWQFSYAYPTAASVPTNALPEGAVGVDLNGYGFTTDFLFGDLYGEVWRLDAATGASKTGSATTPLFAFTFNAASDEHPIGEVPTIYSDGANQYVAVSSGGYADEADGTTAWTKGSQYLVSVKIKASAFPVHETASACNNSTCDLRIKQTLDAGTNGYSSPLVVGNQLFATSDAADVNAATYGTTGTATGHVLTVSGLNGTATTTTYGTAVAYSGASSLANATNSSGAMVLYSSASDKQVQLGTAATTSTGSGVGLVAGATSGLGAGPTVDGTSVPKMTRAVWLRTQ